VPGYVLEPAGVEPGHHGVLGVVGGLGVGDDGPGEGMLRRARHHGGDGEQIRLVEPDGDDVADLGSPWVRVPVLSITTVSIRAEASNAAAFVNNTSRR